MGQPRLLSYDQARRYYDKLGAMLDTQSFYEDAAVEDLASHLDLKTCHNIAEFGCGTGRFAAEMLESLLPKDAFYFGLDVSETMVTLAKDRLARYGERAEIVQSDGTMRIDRPEGTFDCMISTYVLDLLSDDDIRNLLKEAHRVLKPGGRLGLASLTKGRTAVTGLVSSLWSGVHRISPWLVGGCRPIEVSACLASSQWHVDYNNIVSSFGLSSEIVVASKRGMA